MSSSSDLNRYTFSSFISISSSSATDCSFAARSSSSSSSSSGHISCTSITLTPFSISLSDSSIGGRSCLSLLCSSLTLVSTFPSPSCSFVVLSSSAGIIRNFAFRSSSHTYAPISISNCRSPSFSVQFLGNGLPGV